MKKDIRLIAFDLDETLLYSDKTLPEENRLALLEAARAGMEIVPATGRIFCGLPEFIRELPFHYAIYANGAQVVARETGECLYDAYMPNALALRLMAFLDTLPVAYDCYLDGTAYMAKNFYDDLGHYIATPVYLKMVKGMRHAVEYLPDLVKQTGLPVQKAQLFTADHARKAEYMRLLTERFPELSVTTSTPDNLEINAKSANKGEALLALCKKLGLSRKQAMAFGDGLNDVSMIEAAGLGVAMKNACPEVLRVADHVTLTNNEAGVAAAIRKFCF